MPQRAAGWRMEPPVSVAVAPGTSRAATAAAEPPEGPPGTNSGFQGFLTEQSELVSVEEAMANSSRLSLARGTAPAALSLGTRVVCYGGMKLSSKREPQVV